MKKLLFAIGAALLLVSCGDSLTQDPNPWVRWTWPLKSIMTSKTSWLTLEGNIVISVGLFGHSGDDEIIAFAKESFT